MDVVFFTEGSHEMGMGHITRCQAVGQAFEEQGFRPRFYVRGNFNFNKYKLPFTMEKMDWISNVQSILPTLDNHSVSLIDSYYAGPEIYESIREKSLVSAYFDDTHRLNYPSGIVINGAAINSNLTDQKSDKKYLLGIKYQSIRKEFWDIPVKKINSKVEKLLIMFGGTDIRNLTPRIVAILNQINQNLNKHIIIGPGTNKRILEDIELQNTRLYFSPSVKQLKDLMLYCDVAISGAGQSLFELARTGTPTLAVEIIDNQSDIITFLEKKRFLINLGKWGKVDKDVLLKGMLEISSQKTRISMSDSGRKLMDGQGPRRIVNFILDLIKQNGSNKGF